MKGLLSTGPTPSSLNVLTYLNTLNKLQIIYTQFTWNGTNDFNLYDIVYIMYNSLLVSLISPSLSLLKPRRGAIV